MSLNSSQIIGGLQAKVTSIERAHNELQTVLRETSTFYPSLAEAIADHSILAAERDVVELETKKHPAKSTADKLRAAAQGRRTAEKRFRLLKYQLSYYEGAFPWLTEISGRNYKDLLGELEAKNSAEAADVDLDQEQDSVKRWLVDDEYSRLSSAERSDLALKRWRESNLSNWQIGREYERSIGYKYEQQGYHVDYIGAIKGFEDMGRDLVATMGKETIIIQCKYWSKDKTIHEKHVFQLIGTALQHACEREAIELRGMDLRKIHIRPTLVTSTSLSETARRCASQLHVEVFEGQPLEEYPRVKCNINERTRERIYHLPFDEQYDRTRIDAKKGEKYLFSAAEAERAGFRRAQRHRRTRTGGIR